ncbi:SDR family oxidoreductase [Waterburya agarophytonicola K14]|uniref:SDR family oxidoreductase n=1 Tax=Waterburya agarophytonicola KI4 TaxID=2874699 RepID=A0A964BNP9_9CYAN|nr:SDR family oxidoreductase [Waterburya agarophytonicola]MCC0176610.1 SDR family oxidoreductase [Waterburya agarophytonicola KI4]
MKIFVAGATGQTGRNIVRQLVDRDISVKALVRDTDRAKAILPNSVELIVGDVLTPVTFDSHLSDCSVLICATGASPSLDPTGPYQVDYQGTKNLVDIAKNNKIEHFILVSSLCVSKFLHPLNLFWLVLYWKKQAETYIQASGLNYTIVRPGGLKNEDNSEPIVMKSADTLFDGSIPRAKVAQVCVEAIFQPEAKSKIVEIVTDSAAESQTWEQLFSNII